MHIIHPVDALIFQALALSSKRRPAQLVEVIAAVDLIQGTQGIIPSEPALNEAFQRLSAQGLICETEGGFALTPKALQIMSVLPRKASALERISGIRDKLATYTPGVEEHATILLTGEQLTAAILSHQAAGEIAGKNLLVPKPKPSENVNKPGLRQRKPLPARRRKD